MTDARKALESAREALIELAVQAAIDAGLAVNGEHGVAAARHAARFMLDAALASGEQGNATHRHKKRGSEYVLLGIGKMQSEGWYDPSKTISTAKVDMREVAIYRGADGALWVRPREEFEDGRFEALDAPHTRTGYTTVDSSEGKQAKPCYPDPVAATVRKAIGAAIFDPGATEGYKGDRTLTEWQMDAVMRALVRVGLLPTSET